MVDQTRPWGVARPNAVKYPPPTLSEQLLRQALVALIHSILARSLDTPESDYCYSELTDHKWLKGPGRAAAQRKGRQWL